MRVLLGKRAEHKFVCRKVELRSTVEEGYIYEKRDDEGKLFYTGRTVNPDKREKQHEATPTNAAMAEQLEKPYVTTTVAVLATKRQLDRYEERCIYNAITQGEKLLNVSKTSAAVKAVEKRSESVVTINVVQTRFEINCDETKHRYRIRWNEDGKRKDKEFSWAKRTKEEAYAAAQAYQKKLSDEHYGIGQRATPTQS